MRVKAKVEEARIDLEVRELCECKLHKLKEVLLVNGSGTIRTRGITRALCVFLILLPKC